MWKLPFFMTTHNKCAIQSIVPRHLYCWTELLLVQSMSDEPSVIKSPGTCLHTMGQFNMRKGSATS